MIKLLVGHKGSGKTKTMITMANEAAKTSNGNVVVVEKGIQLTYDLSHQVRLVDVEQYGVKNFDAYYGFLCGLMAGNYDITDIFCDATLRVCGNDMNGFIAMAEKLVKVTDANGLTLVFVVSCEESDLPDSLKAYAI
ncbi:MAG: hypothetical protein IKL92_01540 [Oscillospiraceae bacterium]|nr:hypothetical protein [Oscillospiraceae bacterium]